MGFGSGGKFNRIRIIVVINAIILRGLVATNVGLGIEIIIVVGMNIEMVWFEMSDDGNMGGFGEIPELETGHFVDYNGGGLEVV